MAIIPVPLTWWFGSAGGSPATLDVTTVDGSNGFKLSGGAAYNSVYASVTGDINGDGIGDLLVSASGTDADGNYTGASYVVFGSAGGSSATLDVTTLDGSNGFKLVGSAYSDGSVGVSSDGDVNGDGIADLYVSAYGTDADGNYGGATYVVYGRAGGFSGTLDVSALGESDGYEVSHWSSADDGGVFTYDHVLYATTGRGDDTPYEPTDGWPEVLPVDYAHAAETAGHLSQWAEPLTHDNGLLCLA